MGETEERQLQEDFGELRRWIEGLPPMVDRPCCVSFSCWAVYLTVLRPVSGKVVRTSNNAIASGGSQDIYTGEWTGKEVWRCQESSWSFTKFCLLGCTCLSTEPEPCGAGGEMRCSIITPWRRSFDPPRYLSASGDKSKYGGRSDTQIFCHCSV